MRFRLFEFILMCLFCFVSEYFLIISVTLVCFLKFGYFAPQVHHQTKKFTYVFTIKMNKQIVLDGKVCVPLSPVSINSCCEADAVQLNASVALLVGRSAFFVCMCLCKREVMRPVVSMFLSVYCVCT